MTFTGSGAEYFRLWIANLLLAVVTLGIYSAWAKVRRMQYFARNTQLAGASIDFRGSPWVVLRGRLLALLLLIAYRFTFGMAALAWIMAFLAAVALLPVLIRGAMRFRLANTFYRGIAFDFGGGVADGYRAFAPVIVFFLLPGMVLGLTGSETFDDWSFVSVVAFPLLHFVMLRYRMRNLRYGNLTATAAFSARAVWRIYLRNGGAVILLMFTVKAVQVFIMKDTNGSLLDEALSAFVLYLIAIPLFTARLSNLAWSNTSLPGLTIQSTLPAAAFVRLHITNSLWTILSLGLYRPFAVVRLYRFRVAHLAVCIDGDVDTRAAAIARARPGGAGDGATDLFGIDISL
ncbi:MAG: YjgN family protein [Pseudomonadota bacterium]|nr:YjgN family protein [Pseudomonadota bacterium]